jgi:hypothetical protein
MERGMSGGGGVGMRGGGSAEASDGGRMGMEVLRRAERWRAGAAAGVERLARATLFFGDLVAGGAFFSLFGGCAARARDLFSVWCDACARCAEGPLRFAITCERITLFPLA